MVTKEDMEKYREHPIWKTNFSKPVSHIIEDIRNEIFMARGHIHDIEHGTNWGDRVDHVAGLLTCGLVALSVSAKEIAEFEVKQADHERGQSIKFCSRGTGLDIVDCCFVCGSTIREEAANHYLHNIAAHVGSKEDGEEVASWFPEWPDATGNRLHSARLDYREREPNWIQVKIGACNKHLPNLEKLHTITRLNNDVLRRQDVSDAIAFIPEPEWTEEQKQALAEALVIVERVLPEISVEKKMDYLLKFYKDRVSTEAYHAKIEEAKRKRAEKEGVVS